MKLTASFIFLIVLIASGFSEDTTSTTNPTTESTATSVQTDTTVPTETTTVTSTSRQPDTTTVTPSTTPNPPTTSSTVPPTTTTVATTTDKPTTTSPSETTTSPPSPTTVPPSTTTKSPEPPTPVEGSWNVTEGNLTCIRADLKIRFEISIKDRVEYIVLSPNATSNGDCQLSNITQELQLGESEYTLTMIFEKDSNNAYLRNVTFNYNLPDGSGFVYNDTKLFSVKLGNSYMCDSSSTITLKNVTMQVFRIRIQSFGNVGNKDFGTAEECEHKVNDMVPIAVGIALLCLVVVVLIAYFVGRRRSRQKGYQSV